MIKIHHIEYLDGYCIKLWFSDGMHGVYDFAHFIQANTVMTQPLETPSFFRRGFLELGSLVWPNGFDLSAGSLYARLEELGGLQSTKAA